MDKNAKLTYIGDEHWLNTPKDGSEETVAHEDDLRAENMIHDTYTLKSYGEAFESWEKFLRDGGSEDPTFFTYPCPECKRPTTYRADNMSATKHTEGLCNECWIDK